MLLNRLCRKSLNRFVEHDLELIWTFCEYVHFMSDGEMLFQGTPEDVKANRLVAEKYLGM